MSPIVRVPFALGLGFPRVSGDEPALHAAVKCSTGFSPRERG